MEEKGEEKGGGREKNKRKKKFKNIRWWHQA
jgi:hypothetical protein